MEARWFIWVSMFAVGIMNGFVISRVYGTQGASLIQDSIAAPGESSSHRMSSDSSLPPASTIETDDGVGRAARGSLSDWCYALRPDIDPHDNLLVDASEALSGTCPRFVALGELPAATGLGDRIAAWMAAAAVSLTWGMPLAVSGPAPMGNETAEETVGLTRGLRRVERLGLRVADVSIHGSALEDIADEAPETCGDVFRIDPKSRVPLRDLTVARWAFADRIGTAFRRARKLGKPSPSVVFDESTVAVALHVTKSRRGASKSVEISWMQSVTWQLLRLCDTGTFNSNERWAGPTSQPVIFGKSSHAPIHLYVFSDSEADASWVAQMTPNATTIVAPSPQMSEADLFRHLATADALVCGNGTLCHVASLGTTRSLALVPSNKDPSSPYDVCPGDIQCIPDSAQMTQELKLRILDVLDRWLVRRSASCPPVWRYPY